MDLLLDLLVELLRSIYLGEHPKDVDIVADSHLCESLVVIEADEFSQLEVGVPEEAGCARDHGEQARISFHVSEPHHLGARHVVLGSGLLDELVAIVAARVSLLAVA